MPPTRRPLRALGSLQLVEYANNPTRVITELAFIADKQVNALAEGSQGYVDTPLEVQFEEFMDGVNSRGKDTKTRQRKMTVEQAAAILLVTVQKGHVELIPKKEDPHTVDVIKILPEAKRILAAFLPKLRGYGNIPYDQQYRGAIALAKRHFFPKGKAPTKKELMALLLQTYQEKRELTVKCQLIPQPTKTLGIQTSFQTIDGLSHVGLASGENTLCVRSSACTSTMEPSTQSSSKSRAELPNDELHDDNIVVDVEPISVASEAEPVHNDENHDMFSSAGTEPIQCTPIAPRSFNPYMTPISNPRHADNMATTSSLLDASPTSTANNHIKAAPDEVSLTDESIGELLQATATSQGMLNYYYYKFVAACQKIAFLEGQKEEIQREFDLTKKKLDETEQRLLEANADKRKLKNWGDSLLCRVESIYKQLGLLRRMTDPEAIEGEEWPMHNPELQGGFDPNPI